MLFSLMVHYALLNGCLFVLFCRPIWVMFFNFTFTGASTRLGGQKLFTIATTPIPAAVELREAPTGELIPVKRIFTLVFVLSKRANFDNFNLSMTLPSLITFLPGEFDVLFGGPGGIVLFA